MESCAPTISAASLATLAMRPSTIFSLLHTGRPAHECSDTDGLRFRAHTFRQATVTAKQVHSAWCVAGSRREPQWQGAAVDRKVEREPTGCSRAWTAGPPSAARSAARAPASPGPRPPSPPPSPTATPQSAIQSPRLCCLWRAMWRRSLLDLTRLDTDSNAGALLDAELHVC
jgi:hypothetical protein